MNEELQFIIDKFQAELASIKGGLVHRVNQWGSCKPNLYLVNSGYISMRIIIL